MKLTFLGATRTVTGSCYHVECSGSKLLVDCGLFQGGRELDARNRDPFPFSPRELDAVVLTHAHIDHSGLLPRLVKEGFAGPIYCQSATADLAKVMLLDSAHVQEVQARSDNRKRERRGLPPVETIYDAADAERASGQLAPVEYGAPLSLFEGQLGVEFADAGHILGSAHVRLTFREADGPLSMVFSGDVGNLGVPILRDPAPFESADVVLVESTYGDRLHEDRDKREERLCEIIARAAGQGGTIIVPAFAVGRSQELLYALGRIFGQGRAPRIPVFIDSPLAAEATDVFRRHAECYDTEMKRLVEAGEDPLGFPGLKLVRGQQESMELNTLKGPKMIISASGMCNAGRVLHHLKHNLWGRENIVLFVGFQGEGTLGRALARGAKVVQIFGESVRVRCQIEQIGAFSAHADQAGLLQWLDHLSPFPRRVFVVHGEEESSRALAEKINQKHPELAIVPVAGQSVVLTATGECIAEPPPPKVGAPPLLSDLQRDVTHFFDEILSRAKTLARDARSFRRRLAGDPAAWAQFQKSVTGPSDRFRHDLDRVLKDVTGE
ncbi:MAG: MBL fold metallo-hydrolase [Candidatus Riflebacteria bacterium]|nr:MBL fold metallo-hydrolase [Candidatus Riflebacteria bacterium]